MSCCAGPIVVDAACDKLTAARIGLLEDLKASGRKLADGSVNYTLSVPAIHCGQCITTIERELAKVPGVRSARANLSLRRVSLTLASEDVSPQVALEVLDTLGYGTQSLSDNVDGRADGELKGLIRAMAVAGFAAANIMLLSVSVWTGAEGATKELFHFISALIAIPAVAYAGRPFFRSAVAALRHRRVNMDVPISLGVLLATLMSMYESVLGGGHAYFDAAVSLLFFLLIGRTLDHMMRGRAREAASRLARLASKGGFIVGADGELTYLPLDGIQPGMTVRVAAGERFPVDGEVLDGASDVDRALVTGESAPQHIALGAAVEAGTLNLTGPVDIRATRLARDSFLAEITQMMTAAESGRGAYVRLADRMARMYAPVVHVLAGTTFLGWLLWSGGDVHRSLTVAIAVLIITCPCALGLAVPVAHVISASRLFNAGILMKDGSALERLAAITEAVFDKTGTLTTGEPTVDSTTLPAGELSSVAKAMALRSIHPAARALARHITDPAQTALSLLHEVPGFGVEASWNGRKVRLGRVQWVAELASGNDITVDGSGLAFAVEGGELYRVTLAERLRAGAASMVDALAQRNIAVTLLSGDARGAVAAVAKLLGIANYHAALKPGDKLDYLRHAAEQGRKTLMVGDGLNDAPALAAAHVSMAPASASDIGRMAADFVFTRESLEAVTFAQRVARKTGSIVRQNFALAILYNVLAVPLAMAGMLNPLIAAVAMSTSSIIVVANSLRLQRLRARMVELQPPTPLSPAQRLAAAE